MAETVLITPFIMLTLVMLFYLGWNYRRMAQVTNMDRYVVWKQATPGSPGPSRQGYILDDRNPRLNNAFFQLQDDEALRLSELGNNDGYHPLGHDLVRDMQADETFSYYDEFIERNPAGLVERFSARHEQISDFFERSGFTNLTRTAEGHSRLDGDWRYVNGVQNRGGRWLPAGRRVTPGSSLREVFFAEMDDGLEPYDDNGNGLARAIREFYLSYPGYVGPDIGDVPNDD